jgi:thioester reductase-like protein
MRDSEGILITGSTGLLGSQMLKLLISESKGKIFLLIRGITQNEVSEKYKVLMQLHIQEGNELNKGSKIQILKGDLMEANLGIRDYDYRMLCNSVTEIYHCAALTDFHASLDKVRNVNVEGTKNVLEFARNCRDLRKVHYISTVFIAGMHKGSFYERDLEMGQQFNNSYEQSKFEAELLIKKYIKEGLNISVFRPSVIVDEYYNVATRHSGLLYQLFKLLVLEVFDELPVSSNTVLNLMPCDIAAKQIYILSKNGRIGTYHIINTVDISLRHIISIACDYFGCHTPKFLDIENYKFRKVSAAKKRILEPFIPYFNLNAIFKADKSFAMLKSLNFECLEITDKHIYRLLKYIKNNDLMIGDTYGAKKVIKCH